MRQMWAALLSVASMVIAPTLPVVAQDVVIPSNSGIATYDGGTSISGAVPTGLNGTYLYFRKDFENGVGYQDGFSTVGGFVPFHLFENQVFFGQGQMFVTDNGDVGGNIGGGYRYYIESADRVLGAYGFYDNDESARGFEHGQFGIGVENLGPMWDFRANAYIPLDKDEEFVGLNALTGPPLFSGNNVILNGTAFYEQAMGGGDFEFGIPIFDPSAFGRLRAYMGGYAYDTQDGNQAGVRGRLEAHINEHVTVGAAFMHDDVNGDLVTMAVDIRGWSSRLPGLNNRDVSNRAKLYLPVVRQYRIAHETFLANLTTTALGPNGQPIDITWVDNSNAGPGDGTFEDPFSAMPPSAPASDYILVRRGDSTETNPVLGGITLVDEQRMFGEGFSFDITVTGTTFGPGFAGDYSIESFLPAWDTGGNSPFISNPGGNVITLASDNEVGGFNIVSSAGHGITGTGINNFRLFDLNVGLAGFGNGGAGIQLTNASGIGTIDNFTMHSNALGGILVNNTGAAPLTLEIEGTAQTNPLAQIDPNVIGGAVGLSLIADNSTINADVREFFNTSSGTGLILTATNGALLDVDISDSRFDDTTAGDGVQVTVDNATLSLALADVTADNAAGNGLSIDLANGAAFNAAVSGSTFGGASFSGAGGDGVRVIVDNSPNPANSLSFLNTLLNGNGADGLHVELTNASLFEIVFQDGTATGNTGDAIDTSVDGGSTLDLLVDPTDLSGSGENGFRFNVVNGSTLNADFDLVTINGSGQNGILGTLDTLGVANLDFMQVNANGNGEHGMFVTALGGSTMNGLISQSGFNDNSTSAAGFDGINLDADGGAINLSMTDSFAGNSPTGGQSSGLQFLVQNAGSVDIDILRGALNRNDADGVLGEVHDAGSIAEFSLDGVTISDNGGSGVNLLVDTGATLEATVTGGSLVNFNGGDGFELTANDAGTIARVVMTSNNEFSGHTSGAGVRITATDVDEILAIVSGTASDNGDEGIEFNIDGVNDTAVTPIAVAIGVVGFGEVDGNGLDGIEFNVTNSTINSLVTSGVSVTNNALNGIQVNIDNSTILDSGDPLAPAVQIGGGSISNNLGGSGIELNLDTVIAAAANVAIGGTSSISGNSVDGIRVNLLNTPLDGLQIANNFNVSGNGEHGLHVNLTGSDLTNLVVSNNSFSNNTDAGVEFFGDSNVQGTFDGNSISGNQGEGIAINLDNAETFTAVMTGNTVNNNLGGGLIVNAEDTSSFDLTLGGPGLFDGNTFNGNTGAGLGIILNDMARGLLNVENSSFNNTLAAGGPFFTGQGLHVRMFDSSTFDSLSSIVDSEFTGNATQGLHVHVQDFAELEGMLVDGNDFDNAAEGILFTRVSNGIIGSLGPVVISNNTITGGTNGISLVARNSNNQDSYVLNNNTITDVSNVGILIEHGFDARLNVDMDGNTVTGSGSHGIHTFQTAGTLPVELRRLSGTWQNLDVSDNGGDGILLDGRSDGLVITTSMITDNAGVGLHASGPGTMSATFNLIEGNGSHGISVDSVGFKSMSFNNNTIRLNDGDGLRVVNNNNGAGFFFSITANNNLIELNTNRGINVLNQGTADTTFIANGNTINSNGNEGAFFMNTASTAQSADFGAALDATGAVDAIPRLNLTFSTNVVQGNGNGGTTIGGTGGLVLRVGTSDGRDDLPGAYTTDGGTASSGRGGVVATMNANTFSGNAGLDVYIDSFTSTVDPADTGSTDGWTDQNEAVRDNTNDTFNITSYEADPIARLDLVFTNNTGDEWDVTNPGASYDNDEPVFKSRDVTQDDATDAGADDNGPFGSGTRERNAQRFAFRGTLPPDLNINDGTSGDSDDFLFPGVGTSSFRVNASGNSFIGTGFILDDAPYLDPASDAFGVDSGDNFDTPSGGPFGIDDMPWGWSILP